MNTEITVTTIRDLAPSWAQMWAIAFGLYCGFKCVTFLTAPPALRRRNTGRSLGYLLAWPGMDARGFLDAPLRPGSPARPPAALVKAVIGSTMIVIGVDLIRSRSLLVGGWFGMIGMVLVLHFGLFEWIAFAWQRAGVNAEPVMQRPMLARSLADFWGRRWNVSFHRIAYDLMLRPLRRRIGIIAATLATFFISGLFHEAVITLPARGGFGGPTIYFTLQGLGLLVEHRIFRRWHSLNRLFAIAVVVFPLPLLFPKPFVLNVIVPMLNVIGRCAKGGCP